jgi:hypothetical protein
MSKEYYLIAPNGAEIVGTAEKLYATAWIQDPRRRKGGGFEFDYAGESAIRWDSQVTCRDENDERLFVDSEGDQWPESSLKLASRKTKRLPRGKQSSAVVNHE